MRARPLVAVHVLLLRDSEVLLLRRFNTGYEDGNYSVVAGHVEEGEEIIAAALRETLEEVGVRVREEDLTVVGVMHRRSDDERIDFFLAARRWSGEPSVREPDKCDRLCWSSLTSLPDNTIPYVRRALANYRAGRWFDSFGWAGQPAVTD